ncbi:MAG: sulfur carrier protein ThiS [Rhizobiales bacterium]|nr:sulfur carrier protein ThiS [Hyphomicrobiales bacterium]
MKIQINGENAIIDSTNIAQLMVELNYDVDAVATALNGDFVAIFQRADAALNENDRLEIVAPMQGG